MPKATLTALSALFALLRSPSNRALADKYQTELRPRAASAQQTASTYAAPIASGVRPP
jgi:hypothetical protein